MITNGPYRWLRHSSEVGLVVAMAGCALVLGSYAALAATVISLPVCGRALHARERRAQVSVMSARASAPVTRSTIPRPIGVPSSGSMATIMSSASSTRPCVRFSPGESSFT